MEPDQDLVYRLLDSSSALDNINVGHVSEGSSWDSQAEMSDVLKKENAYELLVNCITVPTSKCDSYEYSSSQRNSQSNTDLIRSYRAMALLVNDCNAAANIRRAAASRNNSSVEDDALFTDQLLDSTRAGLLTKKIFEAYRQISSSLHSTPYVLHLNKVLQGLLNGHPSAVVGAACAGGKNAIAANLKPMLLFKPPSSCDSKSSSTLCCSLLSTLTALVTRGCTGRQYDLDASFGIQQHQHGTLYGAQSCADIVLVSKGHRRKFVRSLSEWNVLQELVNCVTAPIDSCKNKSEQDYEEGNNNNGFHAESACDALLAIVDSVCYLPLTQLTPAGVKADDSVGEEAFLSTLASEALIQQLAKATANKSFTTATTASRALLGLLQLATGRGKKSINPPAVDPTDGDDNDTMEAKAAKLDADAKVEMKKNNKLLKSGLTASMHANLISSIDLIVRGLDTCSTEAGDQISDLYLEYEIGREAVRHPGQCIIQKPFTTRRLFLATLLADILCYEDDKIEETNSTPRKKGASGDKSNDVAQTNQYTSTNKALNALMMLPLPSTKVGSISYPCSNNGFVQMAHNPWPGLCNLLFSYPENSLYQVQYYRLIHTLCVANHEATLKLVVQKSKFVTRAIEACKAPPASHRGILLKCLNALRLQSQSLSPRSYLRHYLDSHDGWKGFQDTLKSMTQDQILPGGGFPLPCVGIDINGLRPISSDFAVDIDLGSTFAKDMGFDPLMVKPYVESAEETAGKELAKKAAPSDPSISLTNKKKSKKKKKKSKKKSTENDESTQDGEDEEGDDDNDC